MEKNESIDKIMNLPDYIDKVQKIHSLYCEEDIIVYRGENKVFETPCCPNIFRNSNYSINKFFEKNLLDEMSANKLTRGNSYLLKAIDAQHGEFPSRLLDVTYNSLIALYFAITPFYTEKKDIDDEDDGVVYIFDIEESYCALSCELDKIYNSIIEKESWVSKYEIFQYNHKFINHVKNNERIIAQQGAMILFQGNTFTPIAPNLYHKIIIDSRAKKQLRIDLNNLFGITTDYIYPEVHNKVSNIINKSINYTPYIFSMENELNLFINHFKSYIEYEMERIYVMKNEESIIVENLIIEIERNIKNYRCAIVDFISSTIENVKFEWLLKLQNAYNEELNLFRDKVELLNKEIKISMEELKIDEIH